MHDLVKENEEEGGGRGGEAGAKSLDVVALSSLVGHAIRCFKKERLIRKELQGGQVQRILLNQNQLGKRCNSTARPCWCGVLVRVDLNGIRVARAKKGR